MKHEIPIIIINLLEKHFESGKRNFQNKGSFHHQKMEIDNMIACKTM
jgi:hypothetical protein